ncbi:hypothetical protein Y032_0012g1869 [Ancylostoma ceylanicum]|uniref:Uncharacterized protein n=1 Tax=Ancylostoma ceylanicum TaxID=53326 RepID=A0A016VDQ4_9BILA|nr:hypothetical protein Y032_0012g1869 [Ancylostoma ceylanicum]
MVASQHSAYKTTDQTTALYIFDLKRSGIFLSYSIPVVDQHSNHAALKLISNHFVAIVLSFVDILIDFLNSRHGSFSIAWDVSHHFDKDLRSLLLFDLYRGSNATQKATDINEVLEEAFTVEKTAQKWLPTSKRLISDQEMFPFSRCSLENSETFICQVLL